MPSDPVELETRLADLELRWMQEKSRVDELSDLVWQQARAIETLERTVRGLRSQLDAGPGEVTNDKPPHY